MSIMNYINKYRKKFLIYQISKINLPNFEEDDLVRMHLLFTGRVQGVGFRVEALGIANKLDLSGWVKNKMNGQVEIEVEGSKEKIMYMIDYLTSINRAPVEDVEKTEIEVKNIEKDFEVVY